MANPVKEKRGKENTLNPEDKVKIAFYLPRKTAEDLEDIRIALIRQGRSRRDASQSSLVTEAIELLRKKYSR
ncbi:MAG: hypothetical protein PHE84_00620 [bacterium]|nr:hypothetical protein [bacterium]